MTKNIKKTNLRETISSIIRASYVKVSTTLEKTAFCELIRRKTNQIQNHPQLESLLLQNHRLVRNFEHLGWVHLHLKTLGNFGIILFGNKPTACPIYASFPDIKANARKLASCKMEGMREITNR
jgi:hypothetical protein